MENELILAIKFSSSSVEFLNEYFQKYYIRHGYEKYRGNNAIQFEDPHKVTEMIKDEHKFFFKELLRKNLEAQSIHKAISRLIGTFNLANLNETVFDKEIFNNFIKEYSQLNEEALYLSISNKDSFQISMFYSYINSNEEVISHLNDYLDQYDFKNPYNQISKNVSTQFFSHQLLTNLYLLKSNKRRILLPPDSPLYSEELKNKIYKIVESNSFKNIIKKYIEKYVENYTSEHYLLSHIYKNEVSKFSCGIAIPPKYKLAQNLVEKSQLPENVASINKSLILSNMEEVNNSTGHALFHMVYRELSDLKRLYEKGILTKETLYKKKKRIDDICQDINNRLEKIKTDLNAD